MCKKKNKIQARRFQATNTPLMKRVSRSRVDSTVEKFSLLSGNASNNPGGLLNNRLASIFLKTNPHLTDSRRLEVGTGCA